MPKTHPHILVSAEIPNPTTRTYPNAGGGGTYKRTSYQQHANQIVKEAQALMGLLQQKKEFNPGKNVFFRMELPEEESVFGGSSKKIEELALAELVGAPQKNVGYLKTSHDSFGMLIEQLVQYRDSSSNIGKSKFSKVEKVGHIPTSEKLSQRFDKEVFEKSLRGEYYLSLFPELTRSEVLSYEEVIKAFVIRKSGIFISRCDASSGVFFRVDTNAAVVSELADMVLAVQSVEPVDEVLELSSFPISSIPKSIQLELPQTDAKVCIFDSGIVQGSQFLKGLIIGHEEPIGKPYSTDHGTFVASRVIFGDSLRDQIAANRLLATSRVLSVCVSTSDANGLHKKPTVDQIIPIIRDTVTRWHKEIRVYNLSMNFAPTSPGARATIADDVVSSLAAELDILARTFDVLFVLSAGNVRTRDLDSPVYPDHFKQEYCRITPPAEALLALTVGSIANRENLGSLTKKGHPSPFTRRGPGFCQFRKPDLAEHGGNLGLQWNSTEDLSPAGFDKDGLQLAYAVGTSHATPLISNLASQIFALFPSISSGLAKALLLHFATFPDGIDPSIFQDDAKLPNLIGCGVPRLPTMINSDPHCQSFVFQGQMDFREILRIPFYVPKAMCGRKGDKVRIAYTVVYLPETEKTLRTSYCKSQIRANVFKRSDSEALKKVPKGDLDNVVKTPYATVIHDDRIYSKKIAGGEWELALEHLSRWKLKDTKIPVASIVSVIDPQQQDELDIYNLIRAEVPNKLYPSSRPHVAVPINS